MTERLANKIREYVADCDKYEIGKRYLERLEDGNFTKEENPKDHFCTFFAGYDPKNRKVFVGHHIKSDSWLFNGGHIDKGETPEETVVREMDEEWGKGFSLEPIPKPSIFTITEIDNKRIACKRHYDIWYFIPLDYNLFDPDREKLAEEFYEIGWKTFDEARTLITNENNLLALDKIEELISR